jgi:hypothetical protein
MSRLDAAFFSRTRLGVGMNGKLLVHAFALDTGGFLVEFSEKVDIGCCAEGDFELYGNPDKKNLEILERLEIDWIMNEEQASRFAQEHFPNSYAARGWFSWDQVPNALVRGWLSLKSRLSMSRESRG